MTHRHNQQILYCQVFHTYILQVQKLQSKYCDHIENDAADCLITHTSHDDISADYRLPVRSIYLGRAVQKLGDNQLF